MDPEKDFLLLSKEMRTLDNDALIAIVKNQEEDNVLRLRSAWEVLAERGTRFPVNGANSTLTPTLEQLDSINPFAVAKMQPGIRVAA